MLMGMALLPLVARSMFFGTKVGAVLDAVAGCVVMAGIGIGGAEG